MSLDFDQLPTGFTASKPIDLEPCQFPLVQHWLDTGQAVLQRKRDGLRHYLSRGQAAHVWSRHKGLDLTNLFPDVCAPLERLPPGTILDTELTPRAFADNWAAISGLCNSRPDRAQLLQRATPITFTLFDVLYLNHQPVYKMPYRDRYRIAMSVAKAVNSPWLTISPIVAPYLANAVKAVARHGWEGLVIWRQDHATLVKLEGSTPRVGCYRWKPVHEDDFVATHWTPGEHDIADRMGALHLCQYTKTGQVDYGRVGSGFTDQERLEAMSWTYPCVVQIRYHSRDDRTGSLRFPVFVRKRDDKEEPDERQLP